MEKKIGKQKPKSQNKLKLKILAIRRIDRKDRFE
jgi:hypothetical protein